MHLQVCTVTGTDFVGPHQTPVNYRGVNVHVITEIDPSNEHPADRLFDWPLWEERWRD